jgi:hypothetical protein
LPEASVFWLACAGIVGCPEAMMTASRKQNHILNNPINASRGNNCRADFFALEYPRFLRKSAPDADWVQPITGCFNCRVSNHTYFKTWKKCQPEVRQQVKF